MIRKKLALLILSLCAMFLVGCEKVVELTDEETQLIAEYAAELLLKYDINYVDRIDEGNQKAEEMSSEALEKFINGETTTSNATTEENTKEEVTTEQSEGTNRHESESETGDAGTEEEPVIGTEQDIAVIAGIEGAKITFWEHFVADKYPDTEEQGDFIHLEASQGYRLLVLKFNVENLTDDVLAVNMIDKELDYRLVCNGTSAKPMLTILMDDLGTLETNVEPGVPQEAVLVFQIAEDIQDNLGTMELYVTYNETDNMIKILQ